MQRTLIVSLLLLLPLTLSAQEASTLTGNTIDQESAELTERKEFISVTALPAITRIIGALEAQNAPIPAELTDLLAEGKKIQNAEDIESFALQAARYFGSNWEAEILLDASTLASSDKLLLMRARIELSSLISHAEHIAVHSALSSQEIRAIATDLLKQSLTVDTSDRQKQFFLAFQKFSQDMFEKKPEGNPRAMPLTFTSFLSYAGNALSDISDALPLITTISATNKLREDLADLQSRLQIIGDHQQLNAWTVLFDAFGRKIESLIIPSGLDVLKTDFHTLLQRLSRYLASIEASGIQTGTLLKTVHDLLNELASIDSEDSFDRFLIQIEDILENLPSAASPKES